MDVASQPIETMCQYCTYRNNDGWETLLDYDEVYQDAVGGRANEASNYGFYESWDDLRDQVSPSEPTANRATSEPSVGRD